MPLDVQTLEPKLALAAAAVTKATFITVPAAGSYKAGEDLVFQVAFNHPVVVDGTPRLGLSIGAAARPADYFSGSGSNTLNFHYTIQPGDTDRDGITLARRLSLPTGASIRNVETQMVVSLAITPPPTGRVRVDSTNPVVASVKGPANATSIPGTPLSFVVRFTEPVFATAADHGQVTLPITIGGTTRDAVWDGAGSGTRSLTFKTLVLPGDSAPTGLSVQGPIGLSGNATIRDRAGNDANRTISARFPKAKVDGTWPNAAAMERLLALGIVGDPANAFRILSQVNPDAGPMPTPGTPIPVATLESGFEALFGCLSPDLPTVSLESPHNVDKINFVKSQAATGNFDLLAKPIQNNAAGVTAVAFQPVTYQTDVDLPAGKQSFQVSGGLLLPQGIDKTQLKGVVVYFHGTTFDKSAVPSNYSQEAQLCAEIFASQGYAVVAPDYIGQGVDWSNVHPYVLYPQVSAKTAVDMLAAVKPLITEQFQLTSDDPALKLFSVGYSEGGAYSLWFNSFISNSPTVLDPLYSLTHSVGLEGAYNTSNVIKNFLFSDVSKARSNPFNIQSLSLTNGSKPLLTADALLSFATYGMNGRYDRVFSRRFFQLAASRPISQSLCNLNGQRVNVAQAFAQETGSCAGILLNASLNKRANGTGFLYPTLVDPINDAGKAALALHLSLSTRNNAQALVSSYLVATAAGRTALSRALAAADVDLSPCADGGVSIISLAKDSVVTPNNYDTLLGAYPNKIANAIKLNPDDFFVVSKVITPLIDKLVPGYPWWSPTDHLQAPVYEFIYALNIFNTQASKT